MPPCLMKMKRIYRQLGQVTLYNSLNNSGLSHETPEQAIFIIPPHLTGDLLFQGIIILPTIGKQYATISQPIVGVPFRLVRTSILLVRTNSSIKPTLGRQSSVCMPRHLSGRLVNPALHCRRFWGLLGLLNALAK